MAVEATVPPDWIRVIGVIAKPEPVVVEISIFAPGLTTKSVVKPEPDTLKVCSAEEIQDIYPEFEDMTDFEDTDELETAIEEYMNMNYMDHVQYSDGALDECTINVVLEDDGSEW